MRSNIWVVFECNSIKWTVEIAKMCCNTKKEKGYQGFIALIFVYLKISEAECIVGIFNDRLRVNHSCVFSPRIEDWLARREARDCHKWKVSEPILYGKLSEFEGHVMGVSNCSKVQAYDGRARKNEVKLVILEWITGYLLDFEVEFFYRSGSNFRFKFTFLPLAQSGCCCARKLLSRQNMHVLTSMRSNQSVIQSFLHCEICLSVCLPVRRTICSLAF